MLPDGKPLIPTLSSAMERCKHRLLAALYRDGGPGILRCYHAILESARQEGLTETDEKHLRQIQVAVQKRCLIPGPEKSLGETSAPLRDIFGQIQALLRDRARLRSPWHLTWEAWEKRINLAPWQRNLLFKTAVTFQLTSGCSNFCRRCNEWALPRVRGHFTLEAASKILKELLERGNADLALYGGSDPLDWEDGEASLTDLLATAGPEPNFSLLTKVPRGRERRLKTLVRQGTDLAVSLTNRNRERLAAIEQNLGQSLTKQHATPDLLIPACLDEDFDTVKPSITDSYGSELSPDGAFLIIPTFTSALHPFGHKKIPVTKETPWFPVKKLGRPALLQDYFKPLQVLGKEGTPYYLDHLLDVQVENILLDNGEYDLTPPGMRSVKEYFEVFDEAARLRRRSNTLSVMKRLKKEELRGQSYKDLALSRKAAYRKAISAHLDFTRKGKVLEARCCAASFFLAAAVEYLRSNPVKIEIIAHLTRQEYEAQKRISGGRALIFPDYSDPQTDAWHLFRTQVLNLVHANEDDFLAEVISSCPAAYDPDRDLFVRRP